MTARPVRPATRLEAGVFLGSLVLPVLAGVLFGASEMSAAVIVAAIGVPLAFGVAYWVWRRRCEGV